MTAMLLLLSMFGLVYGATTVAHQLAPHRVRDRSANAVVLALVVPGASAIAFPVAATGIRLWDSALSAALVVGFGAAASIADRRAVLIAAVIVAVPAIGGSLGAAVAGGALGAALVGVGLRIRVPAVKAVAGSLVALALLELEWPGSAAAQLGFTAAAATVLVGAAFVELGRLGRRNLLVGAGALLGAVALAGTGFLGAARSARGEVDSAIAAARSGIGAARDGDLERSGRLLDESARRFRSADDRLSGWLVAPARLVPGLAQNVTALGRMARGGERLATSGAAAVSANRSDVFLVRDGTLDIAGVQDLALDLDRLVFDLGRVLDDLEIVDSRWLLGPVRRAGISLRDEADRTLAEVSTVYEAARVLPDIFGAREPRRWLVAIQNNSESRATGGIIGNYGVLTASAGRVSFGGVGRGGDLNNVVERDERRLVAVDEYLDRYGRFDPIHTWQNVNMSPDVPTVASVVEQLWPQFGEPPIDGVLFVDPIGLARLLELTGPVEVEDWPEPLTAANAAAVLLHEQYLAFPQRERVDFLSDVADAVFGRMTEVDLPGPERLGEVLGPAVAGGFIRVHSTVPVEQSLFERLGVDGALPPVDGDMVAVVTQNSSGNKIDWYLRREVSYDVALDPATGVIEATLQLTLRNDAPPDGLPEYVIGGAGIDPTGLGVNRVIVSVYSPFTLETAEVDGVASTLVGERELDRNVFWTVVAIPAGGTSHLALHLRGTIGSTEYRFRYRAQPMVNPDVLRYRLAVGGGTSRPVVDQQTDVRADVDFVPELPGR